MAGPESELSDLEVLIPTRDRPAALAVTLTSLCSQTYSHFRVVISDQTEGAPAAEAGEVLAAVRVLRAHGQEVTFHRHLPRRGMAEQRQFLLEQATTPYLLFLDDDVILEPWVLAQLLEAMRRLGCGFVGSALHGLSFIRDMRPHQQEITFWDGPITPELITPASSAWARHRLHSAANLYHLQTRLGLTPKKTRAYRVAWVGGCVLYDAAKLRAVGGFGFWRELPREHGGEDVLAQLRVMARFGGCGLIPSGAYHQELPTTVRERRVDAPRVLPVEETDAVI
jgi:GT2 family glycosyltransferase